MYTFSSETNEDWWEVEALYDLAFAPGREALSSYRLRDDVPPVKELSTIARDTDEILAAAIRYWPVRIGEPDALLLGPIAVHPTRQGEGLGGALIRETLSIARQQTWRRVLLIGDLEYYQRFGFQRLNGVSMPPPTNPDRILGLSLVDYGWDGIIGSVEKWVQN